VFLVSKNAGRAHASRTTPISILFKKSGLFFVTALALLIPAATVIERVEGRWLLAPQIFLLIAFVGAVISLWNEYSPNAIMMRCIAASFSLAIVATGLMYRGQAQDYLALQFQPTLALQKLESEVPLNEDWGVIVNQTDSSMPTEWQFGYGAIFSQLPNPPSFVQFGSSWNLCPEVAREYTCFQIELNGLDVSSKILTTAITPKLRAAKMTN
jgi:energy-coupling factor transporter transmembrane protein EcfT